MDKVRRVEGMEEAEGRYLDFRVYIFQPGEGTGTSSGPRKGTCRQSSTYVRHDQLQIQIQQPMNATTIATEHAFYT